MALNPKRHINIDGVTYDIHTGRAISREEVAKPEMSSPVLDLRTPRNESTMQPIVADFEKDTVLPEENKKLIKPDIQKKMSTVEKKPNKPKSRLDFTTFVIMRGIWPKSNFALWQVSLLRTISSPQTWFLLALPLLFVQLRVVQNFTLNEILQKFRNLLLPDNYNVLVMALGSILIFFLIGVIVRAIITNTGIYIRLREIDDRRSSMLLGIRSSIHTLIRQCLGYVFHLIIITLLTTVLAFVAFYILSTSNEWISLSKYQLVVATAIIWFVLLVLLYSKHWIQICLIAKSNSTSRIQARSMKLLSSAISKSGIIGFMGLSMVLINYIIIFTLDWCAISYFIEQKHTPSYIILLLITSLTVILITNTQYLQQNLWARLYYFLSSASPDKNDLLYMEREKPASIWPLAVAIITSTVVIIIYYLLASYFGPSIRGRLANWHADIPTEIQFAVPIKNK